MNVHTLANCQKIKVYLPVSSIDLYSHISKGCLRLWVWSKVDWFRSNSSPFVVRWLSKNRSVRLGDCRIIWGMTFVLQVLIVRYSILYNVLELVMACWLQSVILLPSSKSVTNDWLSRSKLGTHVSEFWDRRSSVKEFQVTNVSSMITEMSLLSKGKQRNNRGMQFRYLSK